MHTPHSLCQRLRPKVLARGGSRTHLGPGVQGSLHASKVCKALQQNNLTTRAAGHKAAAPLSLNSSTSVIAPEMIEASQRPMSGSRRNRSHIQADGLCRALWASHTKFEMTHARMPGLG